MSPHIRTMLDEAADDGGRPVALDLAAVRAAGRRAMWRQRAIVGGGALGAAAVITTIALVLAPGGGGGGIQPAGPGEGSSFDAALEPMITALRSSGYDVTRSPVSHSIGLSDASQEEEGSEGSYSAGISDTYLVAGALTVEDGESTGAAIAAEFTDAAALTDAVLGDTNPPLSRTEVDGYNYTDQCAVFPANVHRSNFAWETCHESEDGLTRTATGGDDYGDALGVTLLRPDGSGVSLAVSSAAYSRPVEGGALAAPPLAEVPLSIEQLLALAEEMLAAGPFFPPPDATVPPSDVPVPPDTDPCDDAVPAFHECVLVGGVSISTLPLADALTANGLTVDKGDSHLVLDVDGTTTTSAVVTFHLSDAEGRAGSAAIGVFDSLDAARMFDGTGDPATGGDLTWCAVAPSGPVTYQWDLADDPTAVCDGIEAADADRTIVVMNDESAAGAIGATLIRPDGSVVTVSVSQAPLVTISAQLTPLTEVPLNRAAILEVLRGVAAAIHGDGIEVIGAGVP